MRFLGLGLSDVVPNANTIWTLREALTRATLDGKPTIEVLFRAYDAALTRAGFLAMARRVNDRRSALSHLEVRPVLRGDRTRSLCTVGSRRVATT